MTIEICIPVDDQQLKDVLIAELSDLEFYGFQEEADNLKGYINQTDFAEEGLESILNKSGLTYSKSIIEETNWNEKWEKEFSPVVVDQFCAIRAEFHTVISDVEHDIIITPKMSFGTGHHATTYLMVQQMASIDFVNKSVADFGTGTGVLSILAEKLGANFIWAIDNDKWSIANAKENVDKNNCSKIEIENLDSFKHPKKFDVILANINRNIILQNLSDLKLGLAENGFLLLSGLLISDEEVILDAAKKLQLNFLSVKEKDGWISILLN